jgi:hypothetical protein
MRRVALGIAVLVLLSSLVAPVATAGARGEGGPRPGGPLVADASATPRAQAAVAPAAKFVLHAGLAAGAFHRYIYKPFKAGTFKSGAKGRRFALLKAGLAGLFAYHELKLAINDAKASKTLARLVAPLTALSARLQALGSSLRGGKVAPADINHVNGQLGMVAAQAAKAGSPIKDLTPPGNLKPTG